MGPCFYGEEQPETGACIFLRFDEDTAVCTKVEEGDKRVNTAVKIGCGCILRTEGKNSQISKYLDEKSKTYKKHMGL